MTTTTKKTTGRATAVVVFTNPVEVMAAELDPGDPTSQVVLQITETIAREGRWTGAGTVLWAKRHGRPLHHDRLDLAAAKRRGAFLQHLLAAEPRLEAGPTEQALNDLIGLMPKELAEEARLRQAARPEATNGAVPHGPPGASSAAEATNGAADDPGAASAGLPEFVLVDGARQTLPWPSFGSWKDEDPNPTPPLTPPVPRVRTDLDRVRDVEAQTLGALIYVNRGPARERFFVHGDVPSQVVSPPPDERGPRPPMLDPLGKDKLRHQLNDVVDFYKRTIVEDDDGDAAIVYSPVGASGELVLHLQGRTVWPQLPELSRLITAPVVTRAGELVDHPGYTPAARLYYVPGRGLTVPAVPARPGADAVGRARAIVWDVLQDFAFASAASLAHAVALFLLPFARDLIDGPTPLHLIDKPAEGTGAGLLVDTLTYPFLGTPPPICKLPDEEESQRKVLTSALAEGPSALVLDNSRALRGAPLAAALTADRWTDRLLGFSRMITVPVRCVWISTGNNVQLHREIRRRTVRIRLDAKMDRPWQRPLSDFTYRDLMRRVREQRGELVWAALVMIRAWLEAGRPLPPAETGFVALGRYEVWSDAMAGILYTSGIPGFLSPDDEGSVNEDSEEVAFRAFVGRWWDTHQDGTAVVRELFLLAVEVDVPLTTRSGGADDSARRQKLGTLLRDRADRRYTLGTVAVTVRRSLNKQDAVVGWHLEPHRASGPAAPTPPRPSAGPAGPATGAGGAAGAAGAMTPVPRSWTPPRASAAGARAPEEAENGPKTAPSDAAEGDGRGWCVDGFDLVEAPSNHDDHVPEISETTEIKNCVSASDAENTQFFGTPISKTPEHGVYGRMVPAARSKPAKTIDVPSPTIAPAPGASEPSGPSDDDEDDDPVVRGVVR